MQTEKQKDRVLRCILCRTETPFSKIPVTADCCPTCGTKSLPEYVDLDVNVIINWHELRILCMWAKNYESKLLKSNPYLDQISVIDIITKLLSKYKPADAAPLSFLGEIQEAMQGSGIDRATLMEGENTTEITTEKKTIH